MNKYNYTIVRRIGLAILLTSILLTSRKEAAEDTGLVNFMDRYPTIQCTAAGCVGSATTGATIRGLGIRHLAKRGEGLLGLLYVASFLYSYDTTAHRINERKTQRKLQKLLDNPSLIIKIIGSGFTFGLCSLAVVFL